MSKINDGGPAYPLHPGVLPDWKWQAGMSLRDAAALAALQGLIASGTYTNAGPDFGDFIVARAMEVADAFIAARAKGGADDRNT